MNTRLGSARRAAVVSIVAVLVAALAVGCTHKHAQDKDGKKHPMLTYQQAADMVEQLLRENSGALHPAPRLEPLGATRSAPCSGPNDDEDTGEVMVERDYWLRDVDRSLNDDIFRQLREYWAGHGYRFVREGSGSTFRKIVAEHLGSGFAVSMTEGQGILSMRAQSTCVPDPEASDAPAPSDDVPSASALSTTRPASSPSIPTR